MGNSIEKPAKKITVVFGDMPYDAEKKTIQCPPTTVNDKMALPKHGLSILEGEVVINLGYAKYEKDENGKIVKVEFLEKEEAQKAQEEAQKAQKVQEETR